MTKDKDKTNKVQGECNSNFHHVETDAFRATFIDNIEKAKELGKEFESSTTIKINLNEYLKTDDPVLKGCEIALQDFQPILDDAKDEVLYIKIKPEDKTVIYHLTAHSDTLAALRELSKDAKSKGFAMMDSRVHIEQAADMMKKKLAGTLKMKKGRHPKMDYLQ
jgi:S-adenosylmethionine hydrolase